MPADMLMPELFREFFGQPADRVPFVCRTCTHRKQEGCTHPALQNQRKESAQLCLHAPRKAGCSGYELDREKLQEIIDDKNQNNQNNEH